MTSTGSLSNSFWWDFYLAAQAGWKDGITPGALTGVLIFIILLYGFIRSRRNPKTLGFHFVVGVVLGKFVCDLGLVDLWMSTAVFNTLLDGIYFFFAVLFLLFGVLLYRDWRIIRQTNDDHRSLTRFSIFIISEKVTKSRALIKPLLWFGGMFLSFVESAWSPDKYVLQILDKMIRSKFAIYSLIPYFIYVLAFLFVLLTAWFGAAQFQRYCRIHPQNIPLSKIYIVASAVFLAYGIALLTYYI